MVLSAINRLSLSMATINLVRVLKHSKSEKVLWANGDSIMRKAVMNLELLNSICDPNVANQPNIFNMDNTDFDDLKSAVSGLVQKKVIQTTVDIQAIGGFSASGSDIAKRRTMEEFFQKDCKYEIYEANEENFKRNYDHQQIRVLHEPNSENLAMYGWSNTLFLCNAGGSHHFTRLRHIAAELGKDVPITTCMDLQALNKGAIDTFNQNYSLYLYDPSTQFSVLSEFIESKKLPAYTCSINDESDLTAPSRGIGLIFLKKTHWNLTQNAESALSNILTNFGSELNNLLITQEANQAFNKYWLG